MLDCHALTDGGFGYAPIGATVGLLQRTTTPACAGGRERFPAAAELVERRLPRDSDYAVLAKPL
jgi:hypothetical protein